MGFNFDCLPFAGNNTTDPLYLSKSWTLNESFYYHDFEVMQIVTKRSPNTEYIKNTKDYNLSLMRDFSKEKETNAP